MRISARVENSMGVNEAIVSTDGGEHRIPIPPRASGIGSSSNGGELLFLALATCYSNDIHREAAARGIRVSSVDVEVTGDFPAAGAPAAGITYTARVAADATEEEIRELMVHTDAIAEVHNTLRQGAEVRLVAVDAVVIRPAAQP